MDALTKSCRISRRDHKASERIREIMDAQPKRNNGFVRTCENDDGGKLPKIGMD